MSCCGKSRTQISGRLLFPASTAINVQPAGTQIRPSPAVSIQPVGTVVFEYTGRSRLTVIGPVTRARYDFVGHGARLNVDRRDSNSIAMVPVLRRV
jgi:hypothetical protein